MSISHKNKSINVGDEVTIFGTNQHGKVVKIAGLFVNIEGVGVKHISTVEPHGFSRFCETKTIRTLREFIEFVKSIPDDYLKGPLLELDCPDEVIETFAQFDESHIISGEDFNENFIEPDGFTEEDRGISGLRNWVKALESEQKDLDNLLVVTDEDGFKNHIVMSVSLNPVRAKISIILEYVAEPAHFEDGLGDIETLIQNWFSEYPELQDSMLRGIQYRESLLNGDNVIPNTITSIELEVADKLLKDCLLQWPDRPYGKNKNVIFAEILKEHRGNDDFMDRVYMLIQLIKNRGVNQFY